MSPAAFFRYPGRPCHESNGPALFSAVAVLVTALGIVGGCCLVLPALLAAAPPPEDSPTLLPDGPDLGTPPGTPWVADPTTAVLLEDLNARRLGVGLVPLRNQTDVAEVAQEIVDEITVSGNLQDVEISAARLSDMLSARGYRAVHLMMAFAQSRSGPEALVEEWSSHDPQTFDRLRDPELRHLGLGIGDVRGNPIYLMVAAVSAVSHFSELSAGLADLNRVRRQVLDEVNRQREAAGLPPYFQRRELDRAAQAYAEDMRQRDFYGHVSPEGEHVLDRVKRTGYRATRVGENIASGQPTVEMVLRGWMDSPDHRANILHRELREMGLGLAHGKTEDGLYEFLWVQVFGSRR